ncbi:MAG TPA: lysophospholipid acyltransferase family protein [Pyrinomonadaceae bacterium]|nr:lysophospholipid acyltransferase family protein [Pyrinomonadaceae bacterium]
MQSTATQQGREGSRRATASVERAYKFADLSAYPFKKRLLIRLADLAFYSLINVLGRSARFEVEGWENHERVVKEGGLPTYCFWHDRIFLTTYWWRRSRAVVMTSRSFDGEYIARFIQRFGYGAVRGSSTRGGVGAVVEMARLMRAGCTTAFTIDGPKGPPRVAKMGAVLLAKKSGYPVLPVTMALARYWTLPSWDKFQIPKPFTRAKVFVAEPIHVPSDADEETLNRKRDELQSALDDLSRRGEEWRETVLRGRKRR